MSCPVLVVPACILGKVVGVVAGSAAGAAASGALGGIATAIQSGVAWIVTNSIDWWTKIPSPNLAAEPAVGRLQQWMLPIAIAVAVFGVLVAGGKMALTRKANPLIDVGSGLVIIAATSAIGVALPALLLKAGDAWSAWVLNASTGGQFATRLTEVLTLGGANPAVVVVLGIVAIIISAIQAVLMLFRQAAIVILAGMLPLAAAGTLTPATRIWFKKPTGWMLALIAYKPAAAAVYATSFTLIGDGKDLRTVLTGFAMILLSLLALPVLMRFFTWTTGAVADSAAGGGFLQTALGGAVAIGAMRGPGGPGAVEQARMISSQLGPQNTGPAGAQAPGVGVRQAAVPSSAPAPGTAPGPAAPAAATGTAGSAGTGMAAGAAGGPAGVAAAGLAAGAATARRVATQAMQPPDDSGAGQS